MAEERASLEELELRIKEEELKLKQAEMMKAKERDLASSKWYSPLVLAILGATLSLVTNVIVTYNNNRTTEETERARAQSSLILEAIRGNNKDTTCENLIFFVNLGLLDDTKSTIRTACPSTKGGVPSLPAASIGWLWVMVVDTDSHLPLDHARVEVRTNMFPSIASGVTDEKGYVSLTILSTLNDAEIVVAKPGYETLTTRAGSPGVLSPQIIYLHRLKPPNPPDKP